MKDDRKCFYDKNYENIKKKLEESNKNIKYCYVQGPTGPKGEVGPTGPRGESGLQGETGPTGPRGNDGAVTVDVGTTETLDSSLPAMVTNEGTNKEVILNFKIPKGERGDVGPAGPRGETGPRGLPGEIGISEVITIDGTETLSSDEEAFVQDDFDRNIHHLTFYIPRGERGDAGPAGASYVPCYAMRFLNYIDELNLTANTEVTIPLSLNGPAFNLDFTTENSINIRKNGFYYVSYYFSATPSESCSMTVSVKADGINLAGGRIEVQWEPFASSVSNSIIVGLKASETISLCAMAMEDISLTFGNNVNATLTVIKLH